MLGEDVDSKRMVGAVGHIENLYPGHQILVEAPNPLLALWESARTKIDLLDWLTSTILLRCLGESICVK